MVQMGSLVATFLLLTNSNAVLALVRPSGPRSSTSLSYRDDPDTSMLPLDLPYFLLHKDDRRQDLKQQLALEAIENFDDTNGRAEELMKQLERIAPWPQTACHPELNARWSFVFTGVPTIGMQLITLLSRLSVGVSVIDFQDVYLEVFQHQQVQATVAATILGQPVELKVVTHLQPDADNPDTFLVETFDKLLLQGVELPNPPQWKTSRSLEISYLDEDMMIARTAGGEPHLLLRHSFCQTDDDTCDSDEELTHTVYLKQARAKYGPTLTRSLVDRDYRGTDDPNPFDVAGIAELVSSILNSKVGGHS